MRGTKLAVLLAFLAATSAGPSASAQRPMAPSPAARIAWGFDRSDLAPHPGVRFGVLPSGMRYALMRNSNAGGGLSARLRIGAGSTVEGKREGGFMHLLEHLIFHGSVNLPEGALLFMLPQQGMKRLSDFNAVTGFGETVYRLDLPRADRASRDTALMVMGEIAGHLRFDRRTVRGAKEAVRQEIGARDASRDRLVGARDAFLVPGAPIARQSIACSAASVGRAGGAALRRLYARYYTPERATLILAGDFDPDVLEAEIAARFANWKADVRTSAAVGSVEAVPAPAPPTWKPVPRGTAFRLFVDPAAATAVTIATVAPLGGADAGARRDASFLEQLGAEMLGVRLARPAAGADAPFAAGAAFIYDHLATARVSQVEISAKDRNWRRALQAGALELERALDRGFSQSELDAQIAASRRALAESGNPKTSAALADGLVDAVGRGLVFTLPGDPSANEVYLAGIRLTDVDAAFKAAWATPGRLIFVAHDRRIADAEAAIGAAWNQRRGAAIGFTLPEARSIRASPSGRAAESQEAGRRR